MSGVPAGARAASLVAGFPKARVAVVGDFVADVYLLGRPVRLSREAPVLILRHEGEELVPGSAANAANNILALGASAVPIGAIGADPRGAWIREFFERAGCDTSGLVTDPAGTIVKTRVMAGESRRQKQQVIRFDQEPAGPWERATEDAIVAAIERAAPEVDAFLFSDYGYRTLSSRVRARALDLTRGKIRVADSRYALAEFGGVTLVTPNQEEAEACLGYPFDGEAAVRRAGADLVSRLALDAAFITRGNLGLAVFDRKGLAESIPVSGPSEIVDVTGAGDTVAAVATLCLVSGSTFSEAARLANQAASVVVMKLRAATLDATELLAAASRGPGE